MGDYSWTKRDRPILLKDRFAMFNGLYLALQVRARERLHVPLPLEPPARIWNCASASYKRATLPPLVFGYATRSHTSPPAMWPAAVAVQGAHAVLDVIGHSGKEGKGFVTGLEAGSCRVTGITSLLVVNQPSQGLIFPVARALR